MSEEFIEKDYSTKMDKTIQSFKKDLASIRTGRANASMLDMIKVDVYGQMMPINQLATISVPEARLITVQVWDQSNVKVVDAAVQKSDFFFSFKIPLLNDVSRGIFNPNIGELKTSCRGPGINAKTAHGRTRHIHHNFMHPPVVLYLEFDGLVVVERPLVI